MNAHHICSKSYFSTINVWVWLNICSVWNWIVWKKRYFNRSNKIAWIGQETNREIEWKRQREKIINVIQFCSVYWLPPPFWTTHTHRENILNLNWGQVINSFVSSNVCVSVWLFEFHVIAKQVLHGKKVQRIRRSIIILRLTDWIKCRWVLNQTN